MTKPSSLLVDVQDALEQDCELGDGEKPPSSSQLRLWAERAHQAVDQTHSEITLRIVDESEMTQLNQGFRGKTGSTNVLSFPVDNEFDFDVQNGLSLTAPPALLGDIVICHSVVVREAAEQKKSINNHYAHMVTHGVLHLHGYDHLDDQSAEQMEALEVTILSASGVENPYS